MKLSVVIVSYNVRHFLEQCLHSVMQSGKGLEMEVFVVDNASVDGSVKMVREKFPEVRCIANPDNVGFAVANNQAIRLSKGEYVLLLNPDTVIESDTLGKVCGFMDSHPDAGGLGVKMVDGTGKFLPESKRGLPTPGVAFFKVFGLSKLFPKSATFNRYHLGHLNPDETHRIDILAGAFMLMRKTALDKTGLLDESFFMYGEDIDLSYRITQAGYNNYYYPETRIIHYKGESTKKGSLNYVYMFYNAMIIFANKHFSHQNARMFSFLIRLAIWFRALLSVAHRVFMKAVLPLLDAVLIYGGLFFFTRYWEQVRIFPLGGHYKPEFYFIVIPSYILVWLTAIYLSGGYDRPVKPYRSSQGIAFGTVFILVIYALLPEYMRFSRILTILGSAWGMAAVLLVRLTLHFAGIQQFRFIRNANKRFLVVGKNGEVHRVVDLLRKALPDAGFIGLVNTENNTGENGFLGHISRLHDITSIYSIDEVIFCARDLAAEEIINQMSGLHDLQVSFKIAPPESLSIIGSNSINTAGDLYVIDINSISTRGNRRMKRLFDIAASLLLTALFPVTFFLFRHPARYLVNLLKVMFGLRTFAGYHPSQSHDHKLPAVRKGILYPTDGLSVKNIDEATVNRVNMLYARDYRPENDLRLVFKAFRKLDRKTGGS